MKKRQEQGATCSVTPRMEAQLNWLIKEIKTAMDVVAEEMKKQATKGFNEVKTRLDSLVDAVLKKASKVVTMQDLGSISTGTRIQNVQNLLHVIETNSKDLNASLQQLQDLSIDINTLSTQTLVHMQRVVNQELEYREQIIISQFLRSQEKEAKMRREVDEMKKEQERLIAKNAKPIQELKKEQTSDKTIICGNVI